MLKMDWILAKTYYCGRDSFAHAHEGPTNHVRDIVKMKSLLLLVLGFSLVAAQEPERCGTC